MVVRAMYRKIQAELDIVGEKNGEETNDNAEARLLKERELAKHYSAVGKTGYTKQVVNHLETLLLDEGFASRLDETEGSWCSATGF